MHTLLESRDGSGPWFGTVGLLGRPQLHCPSSRCHGNQDILIHYLNQTQLGRQHMSQSLKESDRSLISSSQRCDLGALGFGWCPSAGSKGNTWDRGGQESIVHLQCSYPEARETTQQARTHPGQAQSYFSRREWGFWKDGGEGIWKDGGDTRTHGSNESKAN